jgi:hypothetical protein
MEMPWKRMPSMDHISSLQWSLYQWIWYYQWTGNKLVGSLMPTKQKSKDIVENLGLSGKIYNKIAIFSRYIIIN